MKVKDMSKIERPREKLIKYGSEKLTNSELLAIVLRNGNRKENVMDLSKRLNNEFLKLDLQNITFSEIDKLQGPGTVQKCELLAVLELGKRFFGRKEVAVYMSPIDAWNELKDIRSMKKEHFIVIYLDSRNQEIKKEVISVGTVNSSLVHPREVFEGAIKSSAVSIIVAHNHPSNIVEPSLADIEITKQLKSAGRILGIELQDHIIVSRDHFYSFKENNQL